MIRAFSSNETNFNHCDRVLSEVISCYVTETIDGILDLDLVYPLNDSKNLSQGLIRNEIIKCPISATDTRGEQLFRIRKRTPNTKENKVTIYAQAIARRDLDINMVLGLEVPAGKTRKEACQMLLSKCVEPHRYTIGNLDTNPNTTINLGLEEETGNVINYLDISAISPRKAFLDESENSIFKAYGGEIIYNNFEINMVDERGSDHSFEIKSGKNLVELQQEIDDTDTESFATAILPCSSDGVYLPSSEIIYSPNASTLGKRFKHVVFDDVSLVNDTPEAFDVVYAQLRERVQKLFDEGLDKPPVSNTVDFIQLANTEEYQEYAKLEKCEIGNNVTIKYYKRDDKDEAPYIEAVGRVIEIKFNVLKNKIEEVEIGDRKKTSIVTKINTIQTTASKAVTTASETKTDLKKTKKTVNVRIETLERSIELSVTEDDLWSLIEMNPGKILLAVNDGKNGTDVTITPTDGLSVFKGKFQMFNNNDNKIFGVSTSGRVNVFNSIEIVGSNGKWANVASDGVSFFSSSDRFLGGFTLDSNGDLNITSRDGDININCDGKAYINGNEIQTV